MKWLGIALVLYFLIYGFIEEAKERLSGYDDNDNYYDDYDEDWNTQGRKKLLLKHTTYLKLDKRLKIWGMTLLEVKEEL